MRVMNFKVLTLVNHIGSDLSKSSLSQATVAASVETKTFQFKLVSVLV